MLSNVIDREKVCGNCPHCKLRSKENIFLEVPYPNSGDHIFPEGSTFWCFADYKKDGARHGLTPAVRGKQTPVHPIENCGGITKFWNPIDEKEFELKNEIMAEKNKKHKVKVEDCDFFMITVDGSQGSFVRQPDYDTALTEAKRIANVRQDGKEVFILGVVASIKPEVKIEVKEQKR